MFKFAVLGASLHNHNTNAFIEWILNAKLPLELAYFENKM